MPYVLLAWITVSSVIVTLFRFFWLQAPKNNSAASFVKSFDGKEFDFNNVFAISKLFVAVFMVQRIGREGGSTATNLICEIYHFSKKPLFRTFFWIFNPKKLFFRHRNQIHSVLNVLDIFFRLPDSKEKCKNMLIFKSGKFHIPNLSLLTHLPFLWYNVPSFFQMSCHFHVSCYQIG